MYPGSPKYVQTMKMKGNYQRFAKIVALFPG